MATTTRRATSGGRTKAKRASTTRASTTRASTKRITAKRAAATRATKDPAGGLTAAGRARFARTEGSHLRPGVRGAADTPEKMRRKGSFLRRHFANPSGPMRDEHGQPTRLALSAHAWGEPVPKHRADARTLARKGAELLERYAATKQAKTAKRAGAKRAPAKRATAARTRS